MPKQDAKAGWYTNLYCPPPDQRMGRAGEIRANHGKRGTETPPQHVADLFTFEPGARSHLFCNWEFVGAGIACPFIEPGLGGDNERVGTGGAEQRRHSRFRLGRGRAERRR